MKIRSLFTRRCRYCKGRGFLPCHLCDAPDFDCLLCVKGVAPCECPLGAPYEAVTVPVENWKTGEAGTVRMTRKAVTELLDQYRMPEDEVVR